MVDISGLPSTECVQTDRRGYEMVLFINFNIILSCAIKGKSRLSDVFYSSTGPARRMLFSMKNKERFKKFLPRAFKNEHRH